MKTNTKELKALSINPLKVTNAKAKDRSQPKTPSINQQTGLPKIDPSTNMQILSYPNLKDANGKAIYDATFIRMSFEGNVVDTVDKSVVTIEQLAQISKLYKASDRDLLYTDTDKNGLPVTHYATDNVWYTEDSDTTTATFKHPYTPKPTPEIKGIFA